jgi:polysaccharide deacetylase family protein (PEP-CTERM system associated)
MQSTATLETDIRDQASDDSPVRDNRLGPVVNALTIDFEDWYQGLEIPCTEWAGYEDRIERAGHRLLELLASARVRATFFVLGYVAETHPQLVREIAAAGHEVGTHGFSHTLVYRLTPDEFRAEISRSIRLLENLTGSPVLGFRAPFFSITRESFWALDILAECGIRYDSSIYPVTNYRYGIPNAPRWPHRAATQSGELIEFPVSTCRVFGRNLPIAGGAYFRIYPYALTRWAFRRLNRCNRAAAFYLHPWEVDPGHPRIPLPRRIAATHYFNLRGTERKFRRLLTDFRFAPMSEVLNVS